MRRLLVLALFAVPLALAAAPTVLAEKPSDEAKKEYVRFEGTWKFASLEVNGEAQKDSRDSVLTIKGDAFTVKEGGKTFKGTYKVDPTKKPKEIDISFTDGELKGMSMHGIYELDADTYRVCFKQDGKERPTKFSSSDGQILEVLKREKK